MTGLNHVNAFVLDVQRDYQERAFWQCAVRGAIALGVLASVVLAAGCMTTLNGWDGTRCGVYTQDPDAEAIKALGDAASSIAGQINPVPGPGVAPSAPKKTLPTTNRVVPQ